MLGVVLDIDGTLIDADVPDAGRAPDGLIDGVHDVYKRPHADAFLRACFAEFGSVGLWTLSDQTWADAVAFDPALFGEFADRWAFVWAGDRATRSMYAVEDRPGVYPERRWRKKLRKVWKRFPDRFPKHRTVIVEDTPLNCVENYGNAIYISTYLAGEEGDDDDALLRLLPVLRGLAEGDDSVRAVEKRGWEGNK